MLHPQVAVFPLRCCLSPANGDAAVDRLERIGTSVRPGASNLTGKSRVSSNVSSLTVLTTATGHSWSSRRDISRLEALMRTLVAIAALALITTSAQAKVHELKLGGRTTRIEVPSNCKKISCIQVLRSEKASRSKRKGEAAAPVAAVAAPVAAAAATAIAPPPAPVARTEPKPEVQARAEGRAASPIHAPGGRRAQVGRAPLAAASGRPAQDGGCRGGQFIGCRRAEGGACEERGPEPARRVDHREEGRQDPHRAVR